MSPKMRCQRERDIYPQYAASSFKIYTQQQSNSWLTSGSISETWLYIVKMFVLFFSRTSFSSRLLKKAHTANALVNTLLLQHCRHSKRPPLLSSPSSSVAPSVSQAFDDCFVAKWKTRLFGIRTHSPLQIHVYTYNQGAMTLICRRRSNCFFFFLASNTITYTSTRMLCLHVCRFFGMIPTEMSYTVWHERHRT